MYFWTHSSIICIFWQHVIDVDPSLKRNLLFIVCWVVTVFFIWNWSVSEPTFYDSLYRIFFPLCRFPQYKNPCITLYSIFTNKYNNLLLLHPAYETGLSQTHGDKDCQKCIIQSLIMEASMCSTSCWIPFMLSCKGSLSSHSLWGFVTDFCTQWHRIKILVPLQAAESAHMITQKCKQFNS